MQHLLYNKGHAKGTCYAYNSDLNIWARWLDESGVDWQTCRHTDVERFIAWQFRDRGASAHIIARRSSCLSTFYRWCKKRKLVADDPVRLADKPKRPHRIPRWLEQEEQAVLEGAIGQVDDLPDNIFGQKREHVKAVRRRYDLLFTLILNSGLRISEALDLKVGDIRLAAGVAKSMRVIGKGNRERIVPLPEKIGPAIGNRLEGQPPGEYVFAQKPGGKPPGAQAARAYLRRLKERAGIEKKITPHQLRHTYATRLMEKGAELVDIQALLGHANPSTTQIYTHVSQERMVNVVSKL